MSVIKSICWLEAGRVVAEAASIVRAIMRWRLGQCSARRRRLVAAEAIRARCKATMVRLGIRHPSCRVMTLLAIRGSGRSGCDRNMATRREYLRHRHIWLANVMAACAGCARGYDSTVIKMRRDKCRSQMAI